MSTILLTLLIIALVLLLVQVRKTSQKEQELAQTQSAHEQQDSLTASHIAQLQREVDQLSPYRIILDVEQHAHQVREAANQEVYEIRQTAKEELKQAGIKARIIQTQADGMLHEAAKEAARIISTANQRAEEIGGEALSAARNAANLEKTIQALKNVIQGYGDQYLIPSYTLLDELADQFGYAQAGIELKKARERTRLMVNTRTAAICNYVEAVRSTTAVNFITDAFNGKVDTVLTNVRHDNYGTLAQQIKDAYALVNHLGKPFKDARILPEYLQARLDELHWATVAHELKMKEREEQRLIREQIREEEKARRDFERAQRDAAKQEELIQRVITKVQQQADRASAEQRTLFEEQLRELEAKLKTAQEKNERALSMAQQTKSGHVYIISNIGSFGEHVYKIGMTRRLEPLDRVRELGDASVPFEFDVHALLFSQDAPGLERELHRYFLNNQINKVNPRKEFFRVDLGQIRTHIEQLGIEAKWTLTAEAREYRESLAVENALANNTINRAEWEKFQLENAPAEFETEEQEL